MKDQYELLEEQRRAHDDRVVRCAGVAVLTTLAAIVIYAWTVTGVSVYQRYIANSPQNEAKISNLDDLGKLPN